MVVLFFDAALSKLKHCLPFMVVSCHGQEATRKRGCTMGALYNPMAWGLGARVLGPSLLLLLSLSLDRDLGS